MSGPTTTTTLSAPIAQMYAYKLLQSRTRALIHSLAVESKTLPLNNSDTMKFRRYMPLNLATTPLGNSGATPPGQKLIAADVKAKVEWYGTYVTCNEQVVLTSQDPILNVLAERLGVCMKETDDALIRDVLAGTASFQNATGGANGDTPTELVAAAFSKAYGTLRSQDAFPIRHQKTGEDKYATMPTRESYFGLCHTDLIPDLDSITTFVEKVKYPNQTGVLYSEHGSINGFSVFTSSQGSIDTTKSVLGADAYNVLCVGREAAARVSLEGNAKFVYTPPLDPLQQNFTAAVKWVQTPQILNDQYLIRIRTTRKL